MSSNNSIGKVLGACLIVALAARVVPLFGQPKEPNVPLGRADFQQIFKQPDYQFTELGKINMLTPAQKNFSGSFSAALLAQSPAITFQTDFRSALSKASAERKPLVMFIYKEGGQQAANMLKTFGDASLNHYSSKAIFLKLEEQSREGNFYKGQLSESETPLVGVFDVTDTLTLQEIGHTVGGFTPADFDKQFAPLMNTATRSIEASGYAKRVSELDKISPRTKEVEAEIFSLLQKGAALDNAYAANDLGFCYQEGIGTAKDYAKAVTWYRRGIELDNPKSLHNIAICYLNGWGIAKDETKSAEYFRRAADKGVPQSMHQLGLDYLDGVGVDRDYRQAFSWFERAAEKGSADATSYLGWMWENGKSVERNLAKARAYYQKAADLGHKWSADHLAEMAKAN